jgi:prolyl 3-hydroxylase /prolyl 3,4-dihydroxylase
MALFTVQPGRSFHAVQEVYTDDPQKPRLSISGWYHGETPPAGVHSASLRLLKAGGSPVDPFMTLQRDQEVATEWDDSADLSAAERSVLAEWLAPTYLDRRSLRKLVAEWERSSTVQLRDFLRADIAAQVGPTIPLP